MLKAKARNTTPGFSFLILCIWQKSKKNPYFCAEIKNYAKKL